MAIIQLKLTVMTKERIIQPKIKRKHRSQKQTPEVIQVSGLPSKALEESQAE